MADRYPLIYNPTANQIQELQSGDSIDLGNSSVKGATGYATTTGTSSQFLKADGSTDSNTYLTSAGTIALAQGLTGTPSINVGAVSGTNGTFSGNVSAVNVSASSSVTAATFYGDGSSLTGIDASALKDGSNVKVQATATGATITGDISATNATFSGNLTVNGTTTTIDTAVTAVDSLAVDGSVGIGTTNPGNFNGNADDLVIFGTGHQGLTIRSGAANDGSIMFNDTDNANQRGIIRYTHTDDAMAFHTSSGEALRIDSDGKIGIGVTDPSEKLEVRGGKIFIDGGGNRKITLDPGSNATYDSRIDASHTLVFRSYVDAGVGVKTCIFNTNGHLLPGEDNGQDLGASNARWRNIYTGDLNLSNEGSANDVDGTWGQYTIQEGEDDLFLINRRTGKKYKFNLTEVD